MADRLRVRDKLVTASHSFTFWTGTGLTCLMVLLKFFPQPLRWLFDTESNDGTHLMMVAAVSVLATISVFAAELSVKIKEHDTVAQHVGDSVDGLVEDLRSREHVIGDLLDVAPSVREDLGRIVSASRHQNFALMPPAFRAVRKYIEDRFHRFAADLSRLDRQEAWFRGQDSTNIDGDIVEHAGSSSQIAAVSWVTKRVAEFWNGPDGARYWARHLDRGRVRAGGVRRIFIFPSDAPEIEQSMQAVLARQRRAGVDVFTTNEGRLTKFDSGKDELDGRVPDFLLVTSETLRICSVTLDDEAPDPLRRVKVVWGDHRLLDEVSQRFERLLRESTPWSDSTSEMVRAGAEA